jgi:hypothetical protein
MISFVNSDELAEFSSNIVLFSGVDVELVN